MRLLMSSQDAQQNQSARSDGVDSSRTRHCLSFLRSLEKGFKTRKKTTGTLAIYRHWCALPIRSGSAMSPVTAGEANQTFFAWQIIFLQCSAQIFA
jgi:hypothetical protein